MKGKIILLVVIVNDDFKFWFNFFKFVLSFVINISNKILILFNLLISLELLIILSIVGLIIILIINLLSIEGWLSFILMLLVNFV